ncbi:MAG: Flp pilus assembly complex ATPase component TadA [Bdellovibrionales bacterium]|nr:Flp pilus assembly complex ATPase component TadA [Bdellovibrionales bacterium]
MPSGKRGTVETVVIIFGVVLFVIAAYLGLSTASFLSNAQTVTAIVSNVQPRGSELLPVFSFSDLSGNPRVVQALEEPSFVSLKQNDYVLIHYQEDDPSNVRVASFMGLWFSTIATAVPAIICLLAGFLIPMLRGKGSESEQEAAGSGAIRAEYRQPPPTQTATSPDPRVEGAATNRPPSGSFERPSSPSSSTQSTQTNGAAVQVSPSHAKPAPTANNAASGGGRQLFGVLKPLLDDPEISDIIITNHAHVAVRRHGKTELTKYRFPDQKSYVNFVDRLLLESGVTYSTSKPIVDGVLPSGIRVHAVNTVLCEDGPYCTIRLSRYPVVESRQLREGGLAPQSVFDYLEAMVASGNTVLIAGEVASGKTTLLRALAASVPDDNSILVIEDTPEIKIDHRNVRYIRTREANSSGIGQIHHSDCIRAGLRMAMNRIILGEIRDPDAAESFIDVCVSGHPGLSTIHARSAIDAVNRLELFLGRQQRGVSHNIIKGQIGAACQCAVFLNICKKTGKRRIVEVIEIMPDDDRGYVTQRIFGYDIIDGKPAWGRLANASFFESSFRNSMGYSPLDGVPDVLSWSTPAPKRPHA